MRLHHCTWPEVEHYLSRSASILIPTGSTEQHGPSGLIGTDAICADAIAEKAAGLSGDILIAPVLALTPAQFNLGFPGTVSVRASTFISVVTDVIESLARSGFRNFYFLNGHGANIAPLRAAMHDLHQSRSLAQGAGEEGLRFRMKSWWDFTETNALRQKLYGNKEGMHATPSEISITQSIVKFRPFDKSPVAVSPRDKAFFQNHAHDSHNDAYRHRSEFPDGHVGSDPTMANADDGLRLLQTAAAELHADWQDFTQ